MGKKIHIIIWICVYAQCMFGQYQEHTFSSNISIEAKQWEVVDILLQSIAIEKPLNALHTAVFTHSSGKQMELPIIYNGSNGKKSEWLIRFSASEIGNWVFSTKSSISKLNKKKGKIIISKNENHTGSVVLSDTDTRNFYFENKEKYTPIAFECDWLYALDYHNDKEIPKTRHFLDLIQDNGFNQVVMNIFSYDVRWKKDEKLAKHPEHEFGGPKDIFPFLGNNDKPDYSALNIEFFKKFDRTLLAMHDRQIQAHLMIYVWNKLVAWPDMNSDADNMYFEYVVQRYQAFPNVLWDVSKEALYYGRADEAYISERIERIKKNDVYNRLVTVHDYDFCKKHAKEVDYISTQNWKHNIYNTMLDAYNTFKGKPIFNIEHGGYEESDYVVFTGDYTNAEVCLRRNYMCLFAGVGTTYYWQGTSWNVLVYNPFEDPSVTYKPKYEYFKHLQSFWNKFTDKNLEPSPWLNSSGYALANKEGLKLHYVPKENFKIKLGWMLKPEEGKTKTYYWFNTLTGEETKPKPTEGGDFINPWRDKADAILVSLVTENK